MVSLTARVSAFADDITVFVSRRLDIKAVKKAVGEYKRIAGAKVNFDKSEGLRLIACRDSDILPRPFRWRNVPVRILRVWFRPDLQLERNWSEVRAKVNTQVGKLAFKEVEGRRKPMGEVLFVRECRTALPNRLGSSDLSQPRKVFLAILAVARMVIWTTRNKGFMTM